MPRQQHVRPTSATTRRRASSGERHQRTSGDEATTTTTTTDVEQGRLRRVRSFTTRSGTVINRGDSFKVRGGGGGSDGGDGEPRRRRTHGRRGIDVVEIDSATHGTVATESPQRSSSVGTGAYRRLATVATEPVIGPSDDITSTADLPYTVLVLGAHGVGKTTITQQLLTSEYLANKYCNIVEEPGDTLATVTVQIDDEESTVRFVDNHHVEVNVQVTESWSETDEQTTDTTDFSTFLGNENRDGGEYGIGTAAVDGYLVVYSVTDRSSYRYAQSCLQELRPAKRLNAVILVANKFDVVRNRVVSTSEGVRLATKRHCKFVEISALLDHRVDELLVGIVRQIRLRQTREEPVSADEGGGGASGRRSGGASRLATTLGGALRRLVQRATTPTRRRHRKGATPRTSQAECNNLFTP